MQDRGFPYNRSSTFYPDEIAMRLFTVIVLSTLLLAACGQTGPLYLPKDEPKPPVVAPAAEAVPDAATQGTAPEAAGTGEAK